MTEQIPNAKKIPTEWEKITGIRILDPDGWRQDNKDWWEPIDEEEWEKRMMQSTIQMGMTKKRGEG